MLWSAGRDGNHRVRPPQDVSGSLARQSLTAEGGVISIASVGGRGRMAGGERFAAFADVVHIEKDGTMRADVKLGLLFSIGVVLFAGWYFVDQDTTQSTIAILKDEQRLDLAPSRQPEPVAAEPPQASSLDTLAASPAQLPGADDADRPPAGDASDAHTSLADLFKAEREDDPGVGHPEELPGSESGEVIAGATRSGDSAGVATFAPPKPAAPRMETHTVKAGDNIAGIARRYFGDIRYTEYVIAANPHIPDATSLLQIGAVIILPDMESVEFPPTPEKRPVAIAGNTHTIAAGDTLFSIALNRLGAGSRWDDIYELNKGVIGDDAGALEIGQVLKLPER